MSELQLTEFIERPSIVFNDNQGCLASIDNGGSFKANKHYRVRLNRVRKAVRDGLCEFAYRPTAEMTADGLTKPLPFETMVKIWSTAGLSIVRN